MPTLTFLNTTDSPGLSKAAAKQVRGHVTRKVFEARRAEKKRRGRKLQDVNVNHQPNLEDLQQLSQFRKLVPRLVTAQATLSTQQQLQQLVHMVWYDHTNSSSLFNESQMIDLLATEPALAELCFSFALKYYSSSHRLGLYSREYHSQKALSMAIKSIEQDKRSVALLEVAQTMALEERLLDNPEMWDTHMRGGAGILEDMNKPLSDEILGFFVSDCINAAFGLPRAWHPVVISTLSELNPIFITLDRVAKDVLNLRPLLRIHRPPNHTQEMEQVTMKLMLVSRALNLIPDPHIKCMAQALGVLLLAHTNPMSSSLSSEMLLLTRRLGDIPGRTCSLMDLSSCTIWMGAMFSREGTQEGQWFAKKLRKSFMDVKTKEFEPLRRSLERTFAVDGESWVVMFRSLWDELASKGQVQVA